MKNDFLQMFHYQPVDKADLLEHILALCKYPVRYHVATISERMPHVADNGTTFNIRAGITEPIVYALLKLHDANHAIRLPANLVKHRYPKAR